MKPRSARGALGPARVLVHDSLASCHPHALAPSPGSTSRRSGLPGTASQPGHIHPGTPQVNRGVPRGIPLFSCISELFSRLAPAEQRQQLITSAGLQNGNTPWLVHTTQTHFFFNKLPAAGGTPTGRHQPAAAAPRVMEALAVGAMRFHQIAAATARPMVALLSKECVLEPEPALASPVHLCEERKGQRLFVSDSENSRILVVSSKTGRALHAVGSGEPGLLDGTWSMARMHSPAGSVYDEATDTLLFVDAQNRAIRSISLHDQTVTTLHPIQPPLPPPPSLLTRVWARLQYILFLKEAPPGVEAIPGLPQYYQTSRDLLLGAQSGPHAEQRNEDHRRADGARPPSASDVEGPAEQRDSDLDTRLGLPGTEPRAEDAGAFSPWHIALRADGSILVADRRCTRAWHIDPASPGTASLVLDSAVQEEVWASTQKGEQGRRLPGDEWPVDTPALCGTDLLGLPPSWKLPVEPASLRRFRELTGFEEAEASHSCEQRGQEAERAAESAYSFDARIRPGRHAARLHVALPQGWDLADSAGPAAPSESSAASEDGDMASARSLESPNMVHQGSILETCAWVQCRGSVVELSVLGGQLRRRRVSWGQEWIEELSAERWMGTGEYEDHDDVAPDHEGHADVAGAQLDTGARASVDGEGRGHLNIRNSPYIDLAIEASLGKAQIIVDAALYFSRRHRSGGVRSPGNLVVQRLHCCINLDVADGTGALPNFLCKLKDA